MPGREATTRTPGGTGQEERRRGSRQKEQRGGASWTISRRNLPVMLRRSTVDLDTSATAYPVVRCTTEDGRVFAPIPHLTKSANLPSTIQAWASQMSNASSATVLAEMSFGAPEMRYIRDAHHIGSVGQKLDYLRVRASSETRSCC